MVDGQAGTGFIKLTTTDGDRKEDSVSIEVEEPVSQ